MEKIVKYLIITPEYLESIEKLKVELKSLSPELQRFIFYELKNNSVINRISPPIVEKYQKLADKTSYQRMIVDDEKICMCKIWYEMYFNNKIYFKSLCDEGFTFNKKTGKIKFWYGSTIKKCTLLVKSFLKEINCDWFFSMSPFFQDMITKTLLEDILKGKITNPELYIKKFMKTSLKYSFHYKLITNFFKVSALYFRKSENVKIDGEIKIADGDKDIDDVDEFFPEPFDATIIQEPSTDLKTMFVGYKENYNFKKIKLLYNIKEYTIDPNYSLYRLMNNSLSVEYVNTLKDVFDQCKLTGTKINLKWSYKRLQEEHLLLSKKISALQFTGAEKDIVPYFGSPSKYEGIEYKLLDNNLSVFQEGSEMQHCIYSNYWSRTQAKTYFVFSITYPERCTLGVSLNQIMREGSSMNDFITFRLDQVYCKKNYPVSKETRELVMKWVDTDEMQNFFRMNYGTFKSEEIETLAQWREKNCNTKNSGVKEEINYADYFEPQMAQIRMAN